MRLDQKLLHAASSYLCEIARRQEIGGTVDPEKTKHVEQMKLACDDAFRAARNLDFVVSDLVEQTVVQGRRLSQSVPFGSTKSGFDCSEIELLTRSIELDVESDSLIPVRFTRTVACPETGLTTEVEYRLRSVDPAPLHDGSTVTYAVAVAVSAHC